MLPKPAHVLSKASGIPTVWPKREMGKPSTGSQSGHGRHAEAAEHIRDDPRFPGKPVRILRLYACCSEPSAIGELSKRTVKYLSTCTDPSAYIAVTRAAPVGAIERICNAALNVEQGDVHLTPKQRALFRAHREEIATLTSPRVSLARKRKVIQSQKGGFFFIPALIGAALGAIGSKVIGSLIGGQQQ